jgi:hypothetical protein
MRIGQTIIILLPVRKARKRRLLAGPAKGDEPGPGGTKLLTSQALLLLIVAGGIVWLYVRDPRAGAAVALAITALALLQEMVGLVRRYVFRMSEPPAVQGVHDLW